ncbi:MAG: flagellin, partial [Venatoribacter sp.]
IEPAGANYTVRRASDNRVVEGMEGVRFNDGDKITAGGIAVTVSGLPEPGDQVLVNSSPKQSITDTVFRLYQGLMTLGDNPEDSETLGILIADTLTNLTNAEENVSSRRSDLGARMNIVNNTRELAADVKVVNQEILSKLQDVDYAEAISRLSMQTFLLEAAQQSYTTISRLSLFNHM